MSVTVAFDVYPAATPNGSLLVRLLTSGTGTKQAVELSARKVLHGSGEGMIRIHSDHADATSANFAKRNYVKVVLINGATETEWFGFFMESGDFAAVDRRERGGRMLTFSGPGSFYYLDRAVLLEEIYAPGQTRRGSSDVEGSWWWRDEPYGAITTRALEEGFNQPGSPLAEATWDFDRLVDSAAVAWPNIDNEYQVPWGTKVYDLIGNFIKLGLTVTVDADLTFHAWQTYGTNRTSATFAAGKLRFEHGVNIGNDVTRKINANLERSHVFVTGDDLETVVVSGGSSTVTYYDTINRQDTNDPATLTVAGQHNLDAREIQADAAFPVRVVIDDDELAGLYVPGEHYDVGDIATIHTVPPGASANDHDYDNFAIEVAAIRLEHDDAGNWFAVNELGAQYLVAQTSAFEERSSRIIHQVELCRPLTASLAEIEMAPLILDGATDDFTLPSMTDGALFIVLSLSTTAWPPAGADVKWKLSGGGAEQTATLVDSNAQVALYYILDPNAGLGSVHTTAGGYLIGAWVVSGVNQSDPVGVYDFADGTGMSSAGPSIADNGALMLNGGGVFDADFVNDIFSHASPSGAVVQDWARQAQLGSPGFVDELNFGGHGSAAPEWTWDQSHPWGAFVFEVNGSGGSIGDFGPSPVGANGEAAHGDSVRATRCNHVHPHSDLSDHDNETHHHASSVEVTPFSTIAATNVQAALEEVLAEAGGGVDLSAIDFLVGTASGDLSAEIVVGTTPGGELGGTWANPTVDATHSGSAHHTESHQARHANGGADEVPVEGLATAETDTALVLHPDGTGGIEWGTDEGGGSGIAGELVTDIFTGDGAEDTFTLSEAPTGSWAQVSINGSDLLPSEFAITGGDVVFDTAPDVDAEVLVTFITGGFTAPATDPGDIADPTLATAEDVALKLNALMANLRTAGIIA